MALQGFIIFSLLAPIAIGFCPPTGPVLPPPVIANSFSLNALKKVVDASLRSAALPWNASTTSFSVQMTSREGKFFEYHYTAPLRNSSGVQQVRGSTVYRAASVTKVFNVLALLLAAGDKLDQPVSSYLPELNASRYGNVTLRMLAGQLSGTPRWGNAFDLYTTMGQQLEGLGFPLPLPSEVPACDTTTDTPVCTRAEFFDWLNEGQNPLVWQPGDKAAYSNLANILLGYALENITTADFNNLLHSTILDPLGLITTGLAPPNASDAIIPAETGWSWYHMDIGTFRATAGLYSTPDELTTFLRSVLNHELLSPGQTRLWLKPSVFLSSLHGAIGMPWEIFRLTHLTPQPRSVDIYTKSGSLPGYAAYVALLPEYDVGMTVNTAGDDSSETAAKWLLDTSVEALIPALEELARTQARIRYAGRYESATNDGTSNSSMSLVLDIDDGPGLRVMEWTKGGKSVLDAIAAIVGINDDATILDVRAYPVGEDNRWRLVFETRRQNEEGRRSMFDLACETWFQVDNYRYAGLPIDELLFVVADDGVVEGVRSLGLRGEARKL
ncbi:hypothetical protein MFIFM68171_05801 [Madurella fahalii]|uniref:Beta-lactamase-related domain-containing protein n=1 Tax=Madurella fahalii TaxID=1157608 RepID=A0ABQ0GCV5_9PEZI